MAQVNTKIDCNNNNKNHTGDCLPIEESIELTNKLCEKLIQTNDMKSALKALKPYSDRSLYHCYLNTILIILIAVFSMDESDIEKAGKAVNELSKLSHKYRRHGFFAAIMKIIKTPNYNKFTDLEIHAELIHAHSIAFSAGVIALETNNIYGLIRVAYRLQNFIHQLNTCKTMSINKTKWTSDTTRLTFEAGVRLTNGVYHLAISNIPPKLLKVINILGYRGVASVGFKQINKVAFELPGGFSQLARIGLLGYELYVEPHGGLGPKDLTDCKQVLQKELEKYPKSLIFIGASAKYEQLKGRIDNSIRIYRKLLKNVYKTTHKAMQLELLFCHAMKCEWNECIKYAELLRLHTNHSPACATYGEAVFRYLKGTDEKDEAEMNRAQELFKTVESLRIRYMGKTLTPEKFAVVTAEKFLKVDSDVILPELDLLYQPNWLSFMRGNEELLNRLIARVDKKFNEFKDDMTLNDFLDNYLTAIFFRGVLYKFLGNFSEAMNCFTQVLQNEGRIEREFSIPPQAVLELGLTELAQDNYEEAEKWLNKCIADYSGYTNENFVHLRAYAGLRLMGVNTDKQNADEMKLEEYRKQWLKEMNMEENKYEIILNHEELTNKSLSLRKQSIAFT